MKLLDDIWEILENIFLTLLMLGVVFLYKEEAPLLIKLMSIYGYILLLKFGINTFQWLRRNKIIQLSFTKREKSTENKEEE